MSTRHVPVEDRLQRFALCLSLGRVFKKLAGGANTNDPEKQGYVGTLPPCATVFLHLKQLQLVIKMLTF